MPVKHKSLAVCMCNWILYVIGFLYVIQYITSVEVHEISQLIVRTDLDACENVYIN